MTPAENYPVRGQTPIAKGTPVEIIGCSFPKHQHMIGKTGIVRRYVKCRGTYQLELIAGQSWEFMAKNIRAAI